MATLGHEVSSRNDWIFGETRDILNDKKSMRYTNIVSMLNKSTRMFKYKKLPETIKAKDLETYNQVGGFSIWAKDDNGKLYVFQGMLGGKPNPYYLPTIATVANPALNFNKTLTIGEDCIVMLNDRYYQGLMPMFNKYASLLTEAELSLKYAILNARVPAIIQADNDNTRDSAKEFFRKIVEGEDYGIVETKEMFEGITTQDFFKQPYIKDLIESIQYIKGSWYSEIGLMSAFNMKREAINSAEVGVNEDILYPMIDTMLECRKNALEKINEMFGTDIEVELDSVWEINREKDDIAMDYEEAQVENLLNEENETEEKTEEREENIDDENKDDRDTE